MTRKTFNRRDYLAGGMALAASALLPGCGGSDEEEKTLFENKGLITASTQVINCSTTTREVWFVEVHHRGAQTTTVTLAISGSAGQAETTISHKSLGYRSTATIFPLDYATIDTTPSTKTDNDATRTLIRDRLYLKVSIGGVNYWVGSNVTSSTSVFMNIWSFADGTTEREFLFAYSGNASETNWDVAVTFHKTTSDEWGTRRSNFITEVVQDDVPHVDDNGLLVTYPDAHPGIPAQDKKYTAGILEAPTTGLDSIVLPHTRRGDHKALVRPLTQPHSSAHALAHHRRRLNRHMNEYALSIRRESDSTAENMMGKMRRVHNELMKMLYGGTVSKEIGRIASDIVSKIQAKTDDAFWTVDSQLTNLVNEAMKHDTDANFDNMKRSLAATPTQPDKPSFGAGVAASLSVQARIDGTFLIPVIEVPAHTAFRASVQLARVGTASIKKNGATETATTSYRLKSHSTSGVKLTLTFVFGPKSKWNWLSGDFEFNIALTINKNIAKEYRCRVDALVYDPVLDINDSRKWVFGRIEKAVNSLISSSFALNQSGSAATLAGPFTSAPTLSSFSAIGAHAGGLTNAMISPEMANRAKDLFLSATSNYGKNWSMIEISPFRVGFFNSDSYLSFVGSYRGGWKGNVEWGYFGGVKYLGGAGYEIDISTIKGTLRFFGGCDAFIVAGSSGVQGSVINTHVTNSP